MQLFGPSANVLAPLGLVVLLLTPVGLIGVAYGVNSSSYVTRQDEVRPQPVPFSHEHHVSGLGIDCRYCHTSVEESAFAGLPPTHTCMTCHSQIWTNAEMLEPVRESYRTEQPIAWTRVHDLPDFVYFNHSIHVAKGIGCTTCHGPVDRMPLVRQHPKLEMQWCLDCHRNPEQYVRPKEEVFNMKWHPPADQLEQGKKLVEAYGINSLEDCYTCHR